MATAFTCLSTEAVILRTLDELHLRVTDLARLQTDSPIPPWLIQRSLKGDRRLEFDEAKRLEKLCQELRSLHAEVPFPINWRDAERVREILIARREFADAGVRALAYNGDQI